MQFIQVKLAAQQGHRNYAKRQMTWFRREPDVHWVAGFGSDPAVQEEALRLINDFISVKAGELGKLVQFADHEPVDG